jgi:hypothetical protein
LTWTNTPLSGQNERIDQLSKYGQGSNEDMMQISDNDDATMGDIFNETHISYRDIQRPVQLR